LLQPFSSFLDISRSVAGRMRDERAVAHALDEIMSTITRG